MNQKIPTGIWQSEILPQLTSKDIYQLSLASKSFRSLLWPFHITFQLSTVKKLESFFEYVSLIIKEPANLRFEWHSAFKRKNWQGQVHALSLPVYLCETMSSDPNGSRVFETSKD